MNGQGHASLNTSTAGSGRFAEVASSGRLAFQPLGTTEKFDLTQSSSSPYNIGQDSPRRWGDYSQTVVDPIDDQTFWTFQEYANANQSWGVRVIQLKAPPPAVPETASPNTLPIDASPHSVEITGTAPDGAGFFDPTDPGSPYPDYNHISATVDHNVTVNSVTVINRAHLTLDLDTSAATAGYATITITNPDGQLSTCSNAADHRLRLRTVPTAPTPTETKPTSPGNDTSPLVSGSDADCGSRVDLFTDPDCTGPLAGTGTGTSFDSPGHRRIRPREPHHDFYAMATERRRRSSSPCSATGLPYTRGLDPATGDREHRTHRDHQRFDSHLHLQRDGRGRADQLQVLDRHGNAELRHLLGPRPQRHPYERRLPTARTPSASRQPTARATRRSRPAPSRSRRRLRLRPRLRLRLRLRLHLSIRPSPLHPRRRSRARRRHASAGRSSSSPPTRRAPASGAGWTRASSGRCTSPVQAPEEAQARQAQAQGQGDRADRAGRLGSRGPQVQGAAKRR